MKILITGGAGFIGTHLRKKLMSEGHSVYIFDNLLSQVHGANPNIAFSGCEFIKGDVRDINGVKAALQNIDIVYHLAAETGVGQSQYEIERYVSTNTLGTAVVLQAAASAKVKQVIITSSRAVYGEGLHVCPNCNNKYVPLPRRQSELDEGKWDVYCSNCGQSAQAKLMSELDPTMPTSIYGLTKLQQEQLAFQVGQIYDLPVTILRLFNVYGPGQSLTNPYVGVLGTFFRKIMSDNAIDIYEDGQMRRDFVYINDVVDALVIVNNNEIAFNRTINVGTGKAITLQQAGEEVFRTLNVIPKMNFSSKFRLGDIHHAVGDISLIKEILDYQPQTSFSKGLSEYLAWASQNDQDFLNIDSIAEKQLADKNLLRKAKND
jgi:dTDP-L-rhamnose 4-epimerase